MRCVADVAAAWVLCLRRYFVNKRTSESTWLKPEALKSPGAAAEWAEVQDSSGRTYYVNQSSVRRGRGDWVAAWPCGVAWRGVAWRGVA
eukprot:4762456-Prymnesium_polylepis.1